VDSARPLALNDLAPVVYGRVKYANASWRTTNDKLTGLPRPGEDRAARANALCFPVCSAQSRSAFDAEIGRFDYGAWTVLSVLEPYRISWPVGDMRTHVCCPAVQMVCIAASPLLQGNDPIPCKVSHGPEHFFKVRCALSPAGAVLDAGNQDPWQYSPGPTPVSLPALHSHKSAPTARQEGRANIVDRD
jgi:hypothetical protein